MTTRRNLVLVGIVLVSMLGFGTAMSSWTDTGLAGSPDDRQTVVSTEYVTHTRTLNTPLRPVTTNVETITDYRTTTARGDPSRECRPNPMPSDGVDPDEYEYDRYGLHIPDRYVEEMLNMEGVTAIHSGMEGRQSEHGYMLVHEEDARPVPYCRFTGAETDVHVEWQYPGTFTPWESRWTADPAYDLRMGISDQSVEWLLAHDHVDRVTAIRECDADGCETAVIVHSDYRQPPESENWDKDLPDEIDGIEIDYALTREGAGPSTYWCAPHDGGTVCT